MADQKISSLTNALATTAHSFPVADGTTQTYKVNLSLLVGDQTLQGDHNVTGSSTIGTTLDVTGNLTAANFPGTGGGGNTLFDADVGSGATYATLKDAIDDGKKIIEITSSTFETGSITLTSDVSIWFKDGHIVNMGNNQFNLATYVLNTYSVPDQVLGGIHFSLTSAVSCFTGSSGCKLLSSGSSFYALGSQANTPLIKSSDDIECTFYNVFFAGADYPNCGIETGSNSTIYNMTLTSPTSTNIQDILALGANSVADNVYYNNVSAPNNLLFTIGQDAVLSNLTLNSGSDTFSINNYGTFKSSSLNGNDITIFAQTSKTKYLDLDLGLGSIVANGQSYGIVNNTHANIVDLAAAGDDNWKVSNSVFQGNITIGGNNNKFNNNDMLGNLTITNSNSNIIDGNQIDSNVGGAANVVTITGTSTHNMIVNNKVNTLPSDASGNDNLIADNSVHGSAPPPTGGDVVGPAVAVDGHVAGFSGTTGKIIKDLGPNSLINLVDVAPDIPLDGNVLQYDGAAFQWKPLPPVTSGINNFYDTVVSGSGEDYTRVSDAVTAGHKYILIKSPTGNLVVENSNITLTQDIYLFVDGIWDLDNYQFNNNSAFGLTVSITGMNRTHSQFKSAYTTVKSIFANQNSTSINMENISYYNNALTGEGTGRINPTYSSIFKNVYISSPNLINGGIDLSGCDGNRINSLDNVHFEGGGTLCGSVYIPGLYANANNILITGNFYQNPSESDVVLNKQGVIWEDSLSPKLNNISNLTFKPDVVGESYGFSLSSNCNNWNSVGNISLYFYSLRDYQTFENINFGTLISGGSSGGYLNTYINSEKIKIINCINLGEFVSTASPKPSNVTFSGCDFVDVVSFNNKSMKMNNCYSTGNINLSNSNVRVSNTITDGSFVCSSLSGSTISNCGSGLTGSTDTITLDVSSSNNVINGNITYSAIINDGIGNDVDNNVINV